MLHSWPNAEHIYNVNMEHGWRAEHISRSRDWFKINFSKINWKIPLICLKNICNGTLFLVFLASFIITFRINLQRRRWLRIVNKVLKVEFWRTPWLDSICCFHFCYGNVTGQSLKETQFLFLTRHGMDLLIKSKL